MEWQKANLGIFSEIDIKTFQSSHVLVVGCGGLGAHFLNGMVRSAIGKVTIVDDDVYEESNLNRQLFSTPETLGRNKADVVADALKAINPSLDVSVVKTRIQSVGRERFDDVDLIVDAVDNIVSKLHIEGLANDLDLPLLHGAIGGWFAQIGLVMPGSFLLTEFYGEALHGLEKSLRCPTFTLGLTGNLMVAEALKFFTGKPTLENRILFVDALNYEMRILYEKDDSYGSR